MTENFDVICECNCCCEEACDELECQCRQDGCEQDECCGLDASCSNGECNCDCED